MKMNTAKSWLSRNRRTMALAAIPVSFGLWWIFRPEKLFINEAVSEAAPAGIAGELQPEFTGRLEGNAHPTSGRATIYTSPGGQKYLRLSDFATSNGPDVHVVLVHADDQALHQKIVTGNLDTVELGTLRGNLGDQNYDLPSNIDLNKYQSVAIYCERFHAIFGVAHLERF